MVSTTAMVTSEAATTTTSTMNRDVSYGGQRRVLPDHKLSRSAERDVQPMSPTQALGSLRFLVLSHLSDLENKLSQLSERGISELVIDEWSQVALEMLDRIRTDVTSHLPELSDIKAHLHDVPVLDSVCARLPDLAELRSRLADSPFGYIPTLSEHLRSLHAHLSSIDLPSTINFPSLPELSKLYDILDLFLSCELVSETSEAVSKGEDIIERTAKDVAHAVKRSFNGARLIKYHDLPEQWRNNSFVIHGYRFIPLEKWSLIIMSIFAFHNETLNIHTHLLPFVMWTLNSIPSLNPSSFVDAPEAVYTFFALLTLFLSAVWHTMAGCGSADGVEFCARVDYAGIGWLISASTGTIVYYGFQQCHPDLGNFFLAVCLVTGITASVLPFFDWFNQPEYRGFRIGFFVGISFAILVVPLGTLAYLHSPSAMVSFAAPVRRPLLAYFLGFVFYATHFPERFFSSARLDWIGAGSHAIWHTFIVIAISQHRIAMDTLREGMMCPA